MTTTTPISGLSADEARLRHAETQNRMSALIDNLKATSRAAAKEGRDLTATEQTEHDRSMKSAHELRDELRQLQTHIADRAMLKTLGELSGRTDTYNPAGGTATYAAGLGDSIGGAKARDRRWSAKALADLGRTSTGLKAALGGGSIVLPAVLDPTPLRLGERATYIRQLCATASLASTDHYAFVRQSARTNRAAPVARGQLKPTSNYDVVQVTDRVRQLAHLSQPVDKALLTDAPSLAVFLDQELRLGLLLASDDQIVNGSGVGENMLGVLNTPGTLSQAYDGDPLRTTRMALVHQQVLGNTPDAFVMHPLDWANFELMRDGEGGTSGGYLLDAGAPVDRAAGRVWGIDVVATPAVPVGTAIRGQWRESALIHQRDEVTVEWTASYYDPDALGTGVGADLFALNRLIARCEERLGFNLTKPDCFTEIDLTAGA